MAFLLQDTVLIFFSSSFSSSSFFSFETRAFRNSSLENFYCLLCVGPWRGDKLRQVAKVVIKEDPKKVNIRYCLLDATVCNMNWRFHIASTKIYLSAAYVQNRHFTHTHTHTHTHKHTHIYIYIYISFLISMLRVDVPLILSFKNKNFEVRDNGTSFWRSQSCWVLQIRHIKWYEVLPVFSQCILCALHVAVSHSGILQTGCVTQPALKIVVR